MKWFFTLALICLPFVKLTAQNINNWQIKTTIDKEELKFYRAKIQHFVKRRVLDSALIYLKGANDRLLALKKYVEFFDNLYDIGEYSKEMYQYGEGIDILQEGMKLYPSCLINETDSVKLKVKDRVATVLDRLRALYAITNASDVSIDYALKFLNLRKEIYGPKHKFTAHAYTNIGGLYQRNGEYKKAINCFQAALKIYEGLDSKGKYFRKYSFTNLGVVYETQGNYDKALEYYKKALEISLSDVQRNPSMVAGDYSNIAGLYANINFDDLALENYKKALILRIKMFGEKHHWIAILYNKLGDLYKRRKEFGKSIKYYQKALVSNTRKFNDTVNVYALPTELKLVYKNDIFLNSLEAKASILTLVGTQKTNLEQAYKTYQLADQLVDDMRKNLLRKSDELRLTSTVASMYEKVLQVCWRLSKYEKDKPSHLSEEGKTQVPNENLKVKQYNSYWVKAFYFAEKGKSSVLRKLATDASAKIQSNIPEVVLEQERRLNGAILYYQQQLDRFQVKKQLTKRDSIQKQRFEDQRFELRRKYDQLLRDLEEKYPDYYDLKHNSYVASVADVQRRLDAKTALIEYVITEKQLFSFVITREGFQVYEQAIDREKLKKEITRWLNNIQGGSDDAYLPRGYRFFKQFIQPLQAHLKDKKHLLIIPDALLSRLPFEAIITQKEVPIGKPEKYPYLIRKWGVTLYPSASLALMQQQRRGVTYTQEFLGLAPVFEKNFAQQGIFRKKLNALPFTKKEVETIHQLFQKQQKNSKVIIGEKVTEGMVKELKGHYKFIHFATHGFLEDKTPALAFYPNQTKLDFGHFKVTNSEIEI